MLNTVDLNRITAQLKQFGCNQTEAAAYLQALQMGPSPISVLAKKLNLNRLTVHSAAQQLIKKGLLYETRKGKKRLVAAENPDALRRIIQTRYEDLKLMENNLEYVVKLLHSVESSESATPGIRFYEDTEGLKRMLEETLSAKGEVLVFSYIDLLANVVGADYLENYFARRAKADIYTRLILPPGPFTEKVGNKSSEYKIQVRTLPPELQWKSGIFIWNNNIALLSYTLNRLTCTIIENEDIAYFFRNIVFELSWKQAAVKQA